MTALTGKYTCTLRRINSNHSNLRTDAVDGFCNELPTVGAAFSMYAKALTEGCNVRWVQTTAIESLETLGDTAKFITKNSTYEFSAKPNPEASSDHSH